jgi:TolB-like protein/predicted Ser/Thr protein kinase
MPLASGSRLGPFEVLEPLGAGGMGEVYRARDTRLGRIVAVKVLRPDVAADPNRVERFEREARAASALNHPNIVTIHDVGVEGRTSYIAMEWVDGSPLRDLVAPGRPQPIPAVVSLGAQIAEGLAAAHAAGIVHRDLKPDNVMVTADGLAKILDFGLAKLVAAGDEAMSQLATESGGTAAGVLLGTVGYMSPEQAAGRVVDHRSDQFALGVILYELATGVPAFKHDSAAQTLAAIIEDEPKPLEVRNRQVSPQLSRVIARCLAKKPADRYESTRDLAHDLRDLVRESSASRVTAAPARRSIGMAAAVGAIVVLLSAAAGAWWWIAGSRGTDAPADEARRVVAVLPFQDLTGDASRAYFAAGVTEEIRGQLTKVSALRLLGRGAVQQYGNDDLRQLRSELGAGSAVEGSVRIEGQRVRVSVELIDTANQQTLWSEQYDRTLDDVLSVQTDVALRIASALNATLGPEERTRVARPPTTNAAAYELYLRSQELSTGERQQNLRAIELLKKVVSLDPTFAVAHARLAYRVFFLGYYDDPKYVDESIAIAQRAIELDPTLPSAHMALASAYGQKGWASRSRAAFLKALELDPGGGGGGALSNITVLDSEVLGRHDDAIVSARRLLQIRPVRPGIIYHVAWPLLFLRDDATTDRWLTEGLHRAPDNPRLLYLKAALRYLQGEEAAALALARKIVEDRPALEEGLMVAAELAFLTAAPDAEAQIERLFRRSPGIETGPLLKQESYRTSYAYLLLARGERARAATLLGEALTHAHKALENGNENQRVPFEIAAIHATRGEHDPALEWLAKSFAAGYKDYATLGRHRIFAAVRTDPRFQNLLKRMERAVATMREQSSTLAELRTMPFPEWAAPAR